VARRNVSLGRALDDARHVLRFVDRLRIRHFACGIDRRGRFVAR